MGIEQDTPAPRVGTLQNANIIAPEKMFGSVNSAQGGQVAVFGMNVLGKGNRNESPLIFFVRPLEQLEYDSAISFSAYAQYFIAD